jgi:predicted ATP-grasp superfamily ATP-dependent carboligase
LKVTRWRICLVSRIIHRPWQGLAAGRALWGNPPDVLRRIRDPLILAKTLRRRGLTTPNVNVNVNANGISNGPNDPNGPNDSNDPSRWLVKPLASGGGHGVRVWGQGMPVPQHCYLQEFIEGTPGSIVFVAARGRAVPLGITRQLIGEEAFGSSGFGYCGNILGRLGVFNDSLVESACHLAQVVAEEFGLVGVNGIDFIARGDIPCAIEVNPRWCASMELIERAYGVSVFGAHAAACAENALPVFDLARARPLAGAVGKAIVFARHDITVGDTGGWLDDATVRDVPRAGEAVVTGAPICTVFAEGADAADCHAALVQRAERLYASSAVGHTHVIVEQ